MSCSSVEAETITVETYVAAPPEAVWEAIREVYAVHEKLVPGFVVNTEREGDTRIVTFDSGYVVRERIVTIDDDVRRMSYSATEGQASHHMSSMQVVDEGKGARVIWTTDFLPAELGKFIAANMHRGSDVFKATLESQSYARE